MCRIEQPIAAHRRECREEAERGIVGKRALAA